MVLDSLQHCCQFVDIFASPTNVHYIMHTLNTLTEGYEAGASARYREQARQDEED